MRPLEKLVSFFLIEVVCGGLAYAHNRESLREMDLGPVFQEINRDYFQGELTGVRIEWSHLDQKLGEAHSPGDGEFLILVDRNENTSLADVRSTLAHESCHVFVDWQEPEEHGPKFRECMLRFPPEDRL